MKTESKPESSASTAEVGSSCGRELLGGRLVAEPEHGSPSGSGERQPIVPRVMDPALSLASEREMTIRWIWLVPSKICITLASRM